MSDGHYEVVCDCACMSCPLTVSECPDLASAEATALPIPLPAPVMTADGMLSCARRSPCNRESNPGV